MGTGDSMLWVTLKRASIPSRWGGWGGGVEILLIISWYIETREKSRLDGPLGSCIPCSYFCSWIEDQTVHANEADVERKRQTKKILLKKNPASAITE